jgi:hypothetical protein
MGTRLHRRPWLKLLPRSLSPKMSRLSYYSGLWPTLLVVPMGQGVLPLQLRPHTTTSWPLIPHSSPRQESLLRLTIGFVQSSPCLGSYIVRRCKRLFTVQQLRGDVSVWWANYTATHPTDYEVLWTEFCISFHTPYIPAGVMRRKHQEFMDLKQGKRSMHDYFKLFNHLA